MIWMITLLLVSVMINLWLVFVLQLTRQDMKGAWAALRQEQVEVVALTHELESVRLAHRRTRRQRAIGIIAEARA